jgi:uncharacterized membrane protein YhhN
MTSASWVLLVVVVLVAALDWFAVGTDRRHLEYAAKPLTMVALIALALSLHVSQPSVRAAVVVALVLSLVGDVVLMLPGEGWFVFGLAAFLAAHVAYVVSFWWRGVGVYGLLVGLVVVGVAVAVLGRRIVSAVARGPDRDLTAPVVGYLAVISAMVATAIGTGHPTAIAGAALFYCSDALIAWTRFIRDFPQGRLAVMVTYHLAQILLVLSLV